LKTELAYKNAQPANQSYTVIHYSNSWWQCI